LSPPSPSPSREPGPYDRPAAALGEPPPGASSREPGPYDGSAGPVSAAAAQLTTGATRPVAPSPEPVATPRRRVPRLAWAAAIVACVLLGTGAGLWFGRPDAPSASAPQPGPASPRYQPYYLPVTATSPRPGTIRLQFADASGMTGFLYYIVFRDQSLVAHPSSDGAPPYVVYGVDRETEHCWMVAALLETDRQPPPAQAKPACTAADGQPTEN
jgi:serine/threonine-protein kinase